MIYLLSHANDICRTEYSNSMVVIILHCYMYLLKSDQYQTEEISFENVTLNINGTEGHFLNMKSFPAQFHDRFGAATPMILVRECYKELYELVTAEMLSPSRKTYDRSVLKPSFLFTGVPGIGKSVFMIYFLCRYSKDDRFPDKRFAAEFEKGEYCYYRPAKEAGEYFFSEQIDKATLRDILLVVDMDDSTQPRVHAKYTLIFSSPNPKRYKHFIINSFGITYTLPTWTENELCLINPDVDIWYDQYEKLGGVARQVFRNISAVEVIDRLIKDKGDDIIAKFLKHGFGWKDFEINYTLIHINPCRDSDGRYLYSDSNISYTFASDYVFRKLCDYHRDGLLAEAASLFNAGGDIACQKLGGASAGNLFEKLCLWLVPVAGRTITCESLETRENQFVAAIPNYEILNRTWKEEHNLVPGVLYQPAVSNMEAGDAFCVLLMNGETILIVLQITVAEMHPIKANGLTYIYHAFTESIRNQINRKIIVFVTPVDGKLRTKQPLHTQGRTTFKRDQDIPAEAINFEQWVYRHRVTAV